MSRCDKCFDPRPIMHLNKVSDDYGFTQWLCHDCYKPGGKNNSKLERQIEEDYNLSLELAPEEPHAAVVYAALKNNIDIATTYGILQSLGELD